MSTRDDMQRLRHDLNGVMIQTAEIARRLDELEARLEQPAPFVKAPESPASAKVVGPPPLPGAVPPRQTAPPQGPSGDVLPPPPQGRVPVEKLVPVPVDWASAASEAVVSRVRERVDEFRARTREMGWEVLLGTYWLSRIAVLCITIAVVFFLTLAIQRWGAEYLPHLRIGIGYAVSAGLLVLAWRTESKYSGLARVLYGGGFAIMYFVTFATHYIEFARVFTSPIPALVLLALIVVAWAIVAQVRKSRGIAVIVTALGHFTVLLSSLTLDNPGPFAMIGLVALSAGSAFFLLRNRWYYVASLGLAGSYTNDLVALAHGRAGDPYTDFTACMSVLAVFFLVFSLAELFSPEELRRKTVPGWFRNAYVAVNTAAFLLLGSIVMSKFTFTRDHQDLFRFAVAAVLMAIGLGYLRLRASDPLFNIYFVKSVSLVTIGLATRYGGSTLSACLAVEMAVLLISARRSGLIVMRLLAFGAACLAFVQSMGVAAQLALGGHESSWVSRAQIHLTPLAYSAPEYLQYVVSALAGVAAFFVSSRLYQRTDWAARSPKALLFGPEMRAMLWHLDLVSEPPDSLRDRSKALNGLLLPHAYGLGGMALIAAYAFALAQNGHRFAVMAGFALALTILAAILGSHPFGFAAMGLIVLVALPVGTHELLEGAAIDLRVLIPGLLAAGAVALVSEESYLGKRRGLESHQNAVSPYILYGIVAWLAGLLLVKEFPGVNGAFALAAASATAAGLFLILHANAWAAISCGFTLWASLVFVPLALAHERPGPVRFGVAACLLAGLSLAADRYFCFFTKRSPLITPKLCAILVINAFAVLLSHFEKSIASGWLITATALTGFGFLVYGGVLRSQAAVYTAIAGVFYASLRHVFATAGVDATEPGLTVASLLLVAFSLLADRYSSMSPAHRPIAPYLCAGLVINAFVVLLCWFEIDVPGEWLMTATALTCYGFLAYGGLLRSPAAACASVAGIFYASCRHTVAALDASALDTGLVAAFVLLAGFWILSERLLAALTLRAGDTLASAKKMGIDLSSPINALAPIVLATALLLVMLHRLPQLAPANLVFITIGWFALAAVLFVLSLPFRQRFYRYVGLAVILLSLARLFLIDMKEQDPLLRVAAFAVVGTGLLCISVGYYKWMARVRAKTAQQGLPGAPVSRTNE